LLSSVQALDRTQALHLHLLKVEIIYEIPLGHSLTRLDRLAERGLVTLVNLIQQFEFGLELDICSLQVLNELVLRLHDLDLLVQLGVLVLILIAHWRLLLFGLQICRLLKLRLEGRSFKSHDFSFFLLLLR